MIPPNVVAHHRRIFGQAKKNTTLHVWIYSLRYGIEAEPVVKTSNMRHVVCILEIRFLQEIRFLSTIENKYYYKTLPNS